jgi:hypothetical protein
MAVLPIALVTWLQVLALAAFSAVRFPRWPYPLFSGGFILAGFALFVSWSVIGPGVVSLLSQSAPILNQLLPTGWAPLLFQALLSGTRWSLLLFAAAVGVVLTTIPSSLARLRSSYVFIEQIVPEVSDLIPGAEPQTPSESKIETGAERPIRVGPTAIEEMVQSRQFFSAYGWTDGGWLERQLWSWLTDREKVLAEFAFPDGVRLVGPWGKILRNLAICWLAAVAGDLVGPDVGWWILGIGLFFTGSLALARVVGSGRVFQAVSCSGVTIPLYAGYPVGFREMARFLFKISLVQIIPLVLFSVAASMLVFYRLHQPLLAAAIFGLKTAGLIVASRFIFVACSFSSGTNDTASFRLRTVALITFVLCFGFGFLGLAGASLFVPVQGVAWLCWGLAALDAYLFFAVYGWFYNRNRFDLMKLPNPQL